MSFLMVHSGQQRLFAGTWRERTYGVAQHGSHCLPVATKWSIFVARSPSLTFIFQIHFMLNWQLSKQGICWPVSRDRIVGSSRERIEVTVFWSWPLTRLWIFIESRAQVFSQITRTSQKIGALLLGLAKSICYLFHRKWISAASGTLKINQDSFYLWRSRQERFR